MSTLGTFGVIEQFREDVAKFLISMDSIYSKVAILTKRQGDAKQKLTEAFNSAGVFGEVSIHRVSVKLASCKDLLIEGADFWVDFYENVPFNQGDNGTKKGAWWLGEQTLRVLNYERLPGYPHIISPRTGAPALEDVTKDPDSGDLVVRAFFTSKLELPALIP